jgi:hypothetical protein
VHGLFFKKSAIYLTEEPSIFELLGNLTLYYYHMLAIFLADPTTHFPAALLEADYPKYKSFLEESIVNSSIISGSYVGYALAAATTLFPTLCYIPYFLLLVFTKCGLQILYSPVSSLLDWLSRLPSHRIGLIMSGLSALIVLLQAWVAFLRRAAS